MGTANDPQLGRETPDESSKLDETAGPARDIDRKEFFSVLANSIQCAGPHPTREHEKIQEGMTVRKGAMLNIYTGFVPGLVVQDFGIHAMAHMAYVDHVNTKLGEAKLDPMTRAEEDMLTEFVVSGFVDAEAEKKVIIRPDRSPDVLCHALGVLEGLGIQEQEIQFLGKSKDSIDKLKEMGVLHLVDVLGPKQGDYALKAVADSCISTPCGNQYYYARERGERLITPSTFENLVIAVDDVEVLHARVQEIATLSSQQSITAKGQDAAFLAFTETGERNLETGTINGMVKDFLSYIETHRQSWEPAMSARAVQFIRDIAAQQRKELPQIFHHDAMLDAQWNAAMEQVLSKSQDSRGFVPMPERLGHAWSVLPGAYQAYRNVSGQLLTGSRLISASSATFSLEDDRSHRVESTADGLIVYRREGDQLRESVWQFRDGVHKETESLYAWLLDRHPETAYAYVVSRDTSGDSTVVLSGADDYVVVYGEKVSVEKRLHIRPAIALSAEADREAIQKQEARTIAASATLARTLGAEIVAEELLVVEGDSGAIIATAIPLLNQKLLQEQSPAQLTDVEEANAYFGYLGRCAAHAVLGGRTDFGHTDELLPAVFTEGVVPKFAGTRSMSTEIPSVEEFEDSLQKVSARIALDIFSLAKNTGVPPRVELQYVADVFEKAAAEIQRVAGEQEASLRSELQSILSEPEDDDTLMALQARVSVIQSIDVKELRQRLELDVARHLVTLNGLSKEIPWADQGGVFIDSIRNLYTDAVHLLPGDLAKFQASLEQSAMLRGLSTQETVEYVTTSYVHQLCASNGIDVDKLSEFVASLRERTEEDSEDAFLTHLRQQYPDSTISASGSHSLYSALSRPALRA